METLLLRFIDQNYYYNFIESTLTSFSHLKLFLLTIFITLIIIRITQKRTHIYLVDFSCFRGLDTHRIPLSSFVEHVELHLGIFSRETIEFLKKVVTKSGLGNQTYMPTATHLLPSSSSLKYGQEESQIVLFSVVQTLLTKHKLNPKDIDILITNCGLYCPAPSVASMIVNKFGFRSDVKSFNLSGMGCSAGILGVCMARDLLKVHKNSRALVLCTEIVGTNGYRGNVKSMQLPNCLFRMGSAAILLSNRTCDKHVAKYKLQHIVRTHLGAKDDAYRSIIQQVDSEGEVGVCLSRKVVQVAGEALQLNLASLGSLVLPYSEQIQFMFSFLFNKFLPTKGAIYSPNFKKAFDHFCIHAGGKAVIDAIKNRLNLNNWDVEASKMTLHRFGNTSSSSIFYSLSYLEAKKRVKKGDKVCQLGFGSGFKCNSVVWECISDNISNDMANAWYDKIHGFPVEIPEVMDC